MKLYYSSNLNPRVAVCVARHLGSPVDYVAASPRDPANTEAFRAINPNALVPVLVDGERRIWETDAIACYLSRTAGSDFWRTGDDAPEMVMWLSWAAYHFNNAGGALYFDKLIRPRFGLEPADPKFVAESTPRLFGLRQGARRRTGGSPMAARRPPVLRRLPRGDATAVRA